MGEAAATAVKRLAPHVPGDLARNNIIWAIGDSITSAVSVKQYLMWACLLSGGRLRFGSSAGISGDEASQILASLIDVPIAASPRPGFCAVLAGTNDTGHAISLATTAAAMTSMYRKLRAAGIIMVCCTIPPRDSPGATINTAIHLLNLWIVEFAHTHGLPLVDFYAALVDPATGGYTSGYALGDGVHPIGPGAKVMGQAIVNALDPYLPPWSPSLPPDNLNPIGMLTNPLMITDTNADGTPDGWSRPSGAADATFTLENPVGGDVVGKWQQIDKTANTAQTIVRAASLTVASGDLIRFCGRLKWVCGTGQATLGVNDVANGAVVLSVLTTWDMDLAATTFDFVKRVTGSTTSVRIDASVINGTGVLSLGQMQLQNLTALGAA